MKPFAQWWIVVAITNIYAFAYTEAGNVLKAFKDPAGKFSAKRIVAYALIADALLSGVPRDLWTLIFAGLKVLGAVVLLWAAAVTKT